MRTGCLLAIALAVSLLAGCTTRPSGAVDEVRSVPGATADEQGTRIGNLVVRGVPEIPAALTDRLRQYQNTRAASVRGWVGDSLLIATRFGDTTQLHLVGEPLGAREQVTFFAEPVSRAYLPPAANTDGFIYLRDVGGSEFYQLFWHDWATGHARMLSDGQSRYSSVVWSRSGAQFAYTTTERNGASWDIHIQDLAGNRTIALETDKDAWDPVDWGPAGRRLLVGRYVSINESYLYELNLENGQRRALLDESLRVSIGDAAYDGTGTGVYFTSDLGAEFMRLHHQDLATGEIKVLTADLPWDVEAFSVSADGEYLAMTANENGVSRLTVWRLPDHTPIALPEVPTGIIGGLEFSADANQLAFSVNRANAPADAFTIDLTRRKLTRWTRSEVGGLAAAGFAIPELIEYPTFDNRGGVPRRIPAYVFRPSGPGPHPVVVSIHGGPEAQYRPYFSTTIQYLVNELGIAVIAPNVRGSAGYGKTYLKLDNGFLREDSVKDIGALLDWIGEQPDLDPARVAVMGGSYGGYMVLASMVHYGDRLAAGVESVGISNFVTFLTNTQDYRRDLRRAEYGDERDPRMRAHLEAISPLNHVEKIVRPLMISQGANDPRVPASESEQIRQALAAAGTPVWYVLALDEGHGFRKKVNRDYNTAATMLFLEEYLTQ